MESLTSANGPFDDTVYDIRGNAIGTAAEIFGGAIDEQPSTAAPIGSAVAE